MPKFFLALATGVQGAPIAHELRRLGHDVNAIVRDRNSSKAKALADIGVNLFEGDLSDLKAVRTAASGCSAVFWNLPPIYNAFSGVWVQLTDTVLQAARETNTVNQIVHSGSFHTGRYQQEWVGKLSPFLEAYYIAKSQCEKAILNSGFQHITILRPAWLMSNYCAPQNQSYYPDMSTTQTLATAFKPESTMSLIAPGDVAKFAVAAFLNPQKFSGKIIELGHDNKTVVEVARILSDASGINVKVHYRTPGEIQEAASRIGIQAFELLANEYKLDVPESSYNEYGIRLIKFVEFFEGKEEREALKKALGS